MPTPEAVSAIPRLPKRPADSHKGMYGTILAIAGGRGMAGAAALVGAGALRSGAGKVKVACPAEIQPTVAQYEPSYMTYPLANDVKGLVQYEANIGVLDLLVADATVVAAGPGLGRSNEVCELVHWLLREVKLPTVLDADALNNLVGHLACLEGLTRPVIITPHPGEFARLTGMEPAAIAADRIAAATKFAAKYDNLIVVLKGNGTVVTDGHRYFVNESGNPGMSTGGAGDVLTGVIAAMLGQRLPAFEAAQLGTYVHGLAGDIARDQNGEIGMIAGDIVDSLADAFYHLGTAASVEDRD